jgi:hypothetical protein
VDRLVSVGRLNPITVDEDVVSDDLNNDLTKAAFPDHLPIPTLNRLQGLLVMR